MSDNSNCDKVDKYTETMYRIITYHTPTESEVLS